MKFCALLSVRIAAAVLGFGILFGLGPAMAQRPLGIDVSMYQYSINWTNVQAAGITFAWVKATESANYTDPYFTTNAVNSKAVGVLTGFYHFAHPQDNQGIAGADAEAAYFWSVVSNYVIGDGLTIMPALDYETAPGGTNTKASASLWVNEWCQDIVNYGASNGVIVIPVIYAGSSISSAWLNSTVTQWPLWRPSSNGRNPQTGAPSSTSPWSTWTAWQYGQTTLPGITNNVVDEDVFDGTLATLQNYIVSGLPPAITAQPADVSTVETGTATFSVSAIYDPVAYQWVFQGNYIDGATNATLTLTNVQMSDAGDYSVIVFGGYNYSYSANALSYSPGVDLQRRGNAAFEKRHYHLDCHHERHGQAIRQTQLQHGSAGEPGLDRAAYGAAGRSPDQHDLLLPARFQQWAVYRDVCRQFFHLLSLIVESSQAAYSGVWTVASAAPDKYATRITNLPTPRPVRTVPMPCSGPISLRRVCMTFTFGIPGAIVPRRTGDRWLPVTPAPRLL